MEITGNMLTEKHQLIQYFDVGIQDDGYWNYNHMAIQNEDAFYILNVFYPDYDIYLLMDQSSGHCRRAPDVLNAPSMSVWCSGNQHKTHPTVIQQVGPYIPQLKVVDIQHMSLKTGDRGPFYMESPANQKHEKVLILKKIRA